MFVALASGAASADDLDKYRIPCQSQQLKDVQSALKKAKKLLSTADLSLPPINSVTGSKFQRWFGGSEGDNDPIVKAVYAEAVGFINFKTFWCPNASFPGDDPGTFAFVPKGAAPFGEIFIAADFFNTKTAGANSQAGTIVHELVHLSTQRTIVDVVYGTIKAKGLAKTDPQKARRNADNYEYFVEDLVDGVP